MVEDTKSLTKRSRLAWGLICIALGCYPISRALGLLAVDQAGLMAPPWVLSCAGFVFVIAGCMILLANHSRANDLLAGVLCLLFCIMGAWVSLFSPSKGLSGGLALLSDEHNVMLARWIFGAGALVSLATGVDAFQRAIGLSK